MAQLKFRTSILVGGLCSAFFFTTAQAQQQSTESIPAVSAESAASESATEPAAAVSLEDKEKIAKLIQEAEVYLYGDHVPVDLTKAADLYSQAAALGSPKAMMRLSTLYRRGTGVEQSSEKAFELVKAAAEKDYVPAMAALGFFYSDGIGVEKSAEKADYWLEKAAENGHKLARVVTGEKYLAKADDPQAQAKGRFLIDTLLENGSPSELYTISYSYGHGYRLPKDEDKAIFWAKAAAKKGGVNAMFYLGECYWNRQDYPQALSWFEKAAEMGLGAAELQTGRLYRDGAQGVDPDPVKAVLWLTKAAPYARNDDLLSLVKLYQTGPQSIRSRDQAQKYLDIYIKKASTSELQNEADRFWSGTGVRKNFNLGGALSLAAIQKGDRSQVCEFAMRLAQPNWIHFDPVTAYSILNQCALDKNVTDEVKQAFIALENRMSAEQIQKAQEIDGEEALNNYLNLHQPSIK